MRRIPTKKVFVYALIPAVLVVAASVAGVRYNYTNSVAGKIWLERAPHELARNDYIFLCIDDQQIIAEIKHYLIDGECGGYVGMLKKIVGVEGDVAQFTTDGIIINGEKIANSTPVTPDKLVYALAPYAGRMVIAANQYVVVGETATSLDSRYYGPIDRKWITGKAIKLF